MYSLYDDSTRVLRENSSAQIDRILQSNRENHEHQKIFLGYIVMQKTKAHQA